MPKFNAEDCLEMRSSKGLIVLEGIPLGGAVGVDGVGLYFGASMCSQPLQC